MKVWGLELGFWVCSPVGDGRDGAAKVAEILRKVDGATRHEVAVHLRQV